MFSPRPSLLLSLTTLTLVTAAFLAAPSWADGGVVVAPGNQSGKYATPTVDLGAAAPGGPASSGGLGGPSSSPEPSSSDAGGPALPAWCRDAYCTADFGPGPNAPAMPLDGHLGFVCAAPQNQKLCPPPPAAPPAPGAPPGPGVTPAVLAQQAAAQLRLPLPTPRHSPDLRLRDGRAATLVGEHTWFWTDPPQWTPQTAWVQAGPVWAEATATPVALSLDPRNGQPVQSCRGPGTPYNPSFGMHAASPDCDVVYLHSSIDAPDGQVTAEWAITWRVTWHGWTGTTPVGGELPPMVSRTTATFAVAEAQALLH